MLLIYSSERKPHRQTLTHTVSSPLSHASPCVRRCCYDAAFGERGDSEVPSGSFADPLRKLVADSPGQAPHPGSPGFHARPAHPSVETLHVVHHKHFPIFECFNHKLNCLSSIVLRLYYHEKSGMFHDVAVDPGGDRTTYIQAWSKTGNIAPSMPEQHRLFEQEDRALEGGVDVVYPKA